ncbi:MAG: hypothetical protein ACI4PG_04755 [Candidatus Ventricola sp.]
MKKAMILLLAALMTLAAANACAKTLAPMPARLDPDAVANQAVYVRLRDIDWHAQTVTVALCEPEIFAREDVESLCPGDILLSGGEEIRVDSVAKDWPVVFINPDEDFLALYENADGNFESMLYERRIWTEVGERTFALSDELVFLDGIDPSTGEALTLPTAHTLQALKDILTGTAYDPGFAADNAYLVLGDEQEAVVLARYYVPWQ